MNGIRKTCRWAINTNGFLGEVSKLHVALAYFMPCLRLWAASHCMHAVCAYRHLQVKFWLPWRCRCKFEVGINYIAPVINLHSSWQEPWSPIKVFCSHGCMGCVSMWAVALSRCYLPMKSLMVVVDGAFLLLPAKHSAYQGCVHRSSLLPYLEMHTTLSGISCWGGRRLCGQIQTSWAQLSPALQELALLHKCGSPVDCTCAHWPSGFMRLQSLATECKFALSISYFRFISEPWLVHISCCNTAKAFQALVLQPSNVNWGQ